MAGKKDNLKALFSNTRSRVIILFTLCLLVISVVIGVLKFSNIGRPSTESTANVGNAPGAIQSIPGALNQTSQYATLQQMQNVNEAKQASKSGQSAIPTIIRSQAFGEGIENVGPQHGMGGVGFATLAREENEGTQKSLWLQTLRNSNCSQASLQQVVSQGAQLSDIQTVCSCAQLKDDGYKLNDLQSVCSCKDLKAIGFNARQLKDAGYTAGKLRLCGFDACELRSAGFTAQEMKDGGYSDGELKGAGYSDNDIARASGLPDGITADDVRKVGCDVAGLTRLRKEGVSAAAIERISGCSAVKLREAGFDAKALRDAGFSAAQLRLAGFTPDQLAQAGYSARDLLDAGLTPDELSALGFTQAQIKAAEAELPLGVTPEDVKNAGCDAAAIKRERLSGISALSIRQYAGCSAKALKEAGFTDSDLANAGFTPEQIKAVGELTGGQLPSVDDSTIRAAGCDPQKLDLLKKQGVTAKRIHQLNGCSAADLKKAGYTAADLADAGFTPQQLLEAGFTPAEVKSAFPVDDAVVRAAGCDVSKLRKLNEEGVSAKRIRELNSCSLDALKEAGFDAKQLANAGFTPQELLAAGFTPDQLRQAGLNPSGVISVGRTANCSIASLKTARTLHVSAATIKQSLGCSAKAMKEAGYTAAELKEAGFTAAELKNAGFSATDLKNAGFSAKELAAAGFTAEQLKQAGFSNKDLKDAGFTAADLRKLGLTAEQLKALGYSAKDLKDAGFSAAELRKAGFSAKDLKDAGFSAEALRQAGFSAADLKNAGFSDAQLQQAGYSKEELQQAGIIPSGSFLSGLESMSQRVVPIGPNNNLPRVPGSVPAANLQAAAGTEQLQKILKRQQTQLADQRSQQKIQQRTIGMLAAATQSMNGWKQVSTQTYVATSEKEKAAPGQNIGMMGQQNESQSQQQEPGATNPQDTKVLIKSGDVLFAVLDTSVNSDEPGPILATIVSGRLKGSKLIGSFTRPSNADKMVINFNTMSVPGAAHTTQISAYAIDPNTARTALASRADHHYLLRYGSLFAATFIEGFGNAFQSANTTITIGGTGNMQNTTVQSGVGRSILENAVIGLATLGKSWSQVAMQEFSRPTTVDLYSGTGLGILFTQDLKSL